MNEFFLALLAFILGILSTLITQFFSRQLKIKDARQKKKIEHLHQIREWMTAYQELFKCKFPQVLELVLANKYFAPNFVEITFLGRSIEFKKPDETFSRVYNVLCEFHEAKEKYDGIERNAVRSLNALGAKKKIKLPSVLWRRIRKLFRIQTQEAFEIATEEFLFYPQGFLKEIAPKLSKLFQQKQILFVKFPMEFAYYIDWEKLTTIEAKDVSKIIHSKLHQHQYPKLPSRPNEIAKFIDENLGMYVGHTDEETELIDSMSDLDQHRYFANNAIEEVLQIIDKYETIWATPE